jgi:methionyl-tRNA formyltransferase
LPLRILMMGTGAFALPVFKALVESEHEVVGLVTQPDRVGRGHHQHVNPLKEFAIERGIPVLQPEKVRTDESLDALRALNADLYVVAAYGQILTNKLLAIPRLGAINVHGSILPKYRGAAPIQYAIWKGEKESGVSIFQIVRELDAGPVFGIAKTPIQSDETYGQLHDRLAEFSVGITLDVVNQLDQGIAISVPQDPSQVTFSPRIEKEEGLIDWSKSTEELGWHLRAMQPWPNPYTFLHLAGKPPQRVIITKLQPYHRDLPFEHLSPGDLLSTPDRELLVRTGDGLAKIITLQPAGKRGMTAADFLLGTTISPGDKLANT